MKWNLAFSYPDNSVAVVNPRKWIMRLDSYHWSAVASEYYGEWQSFYLPEPSKLFPTAPLVSTVEHKTILDVGAGCGETAAFYFDKGARKIIAVEIDRQSSKMIKTNASLNDWNIEIINSPFDFTCLSRHEIDLAKIDCEKCEVGMLDCDEILFDVITEIHGRDLLVAFRKKFPDMKVRQRLYNSEFGDLYYAIVPRLR